MIQARHIDYATLPDKMTKIATIDFPQDVLQLTFPYTATEDCFIRLSDSGTVSQNNKQIRDANNTGYTWHFVAKGDVIRQVNGSNACYLFPVRYV